ncbi:YbaB/EbfC family nucleoid-associated protein [Actinokineospora pegani]|uniref:YbaB/EbfC family nucleoid-associated protein n=1 Tax=Actinokineospora pegani TaxID=2654637 RepID=UPI0012EAAC28|nr:YbaB/EbfC family nucleoid-associated protein [Actinokineospora pegani]
MDAEQWLAQYDKKLTEVAARAKEAGERLREVGATASSRRGEVRVRVGASGVLEDLTLAPSARTLESDELARLILETTRKARHAVSRQVAGISTECFGEGPALEVIKRHLPAGARPRGGADSDDDYFANPPEITR